MKYYAKHRKDINIKKKPYWKNRYKENRMLKNYTYPEIDNLNSTQLSYIAGLLDGEGSFNILANGPTKTLTTSITVQMNSLETIEWLSKGLGVSYSIVRRKEKNHKTGWRIALVGKRATYLTGKVYPYLITKRKQAEIILEFGRVGYFHVDNKLSKAQIKHNRQELKGKIRPLNARGSQQ